MMPGNSDKEPLIGWHYDAAGRLVPVDEHETEKWSVAVDSLKEAYIRRLRVQRAAAQTFPDWK
jgi:hypothetical protein